MEYLSFVRDNELGNIYIAKVDHIVKNINAAFVRYDKDKTGYLPLRNITGACVINRPFESGDALKNGDDVIVQVESEAVKTKKTKLTTNLSVSDDYVAVTLGKYGVGASIKLSDNIRTLLADEIKADYETIMQEYTDELFGASAGIFDSLCAFLMFTKLVCHIWEYRFYTECSILLRTSGVSAFIRRGSTWMRSSEKRTFLFLRWNHKIL